MKRENVNTKIKLWTQMEVFVGHLRPHEDVDEDQRDAADHSGAGTRLLRVAPHRPGHAGKVSFGKGSGSNID